jgi:hypothetical protein
MDEQGNTGRWTAWIREDGGPWQAVGTFDCYDDATAHSLTVRSSAKLLDTMVLPSGRLPEPHSGRMTQPGDAVRVP